MTRTRQSNRIDTHSGLAQRNNKNKCKNPTKRERRDMSALRQHHIELVRVAFLELDLLCYESGICVVTIFGVFAYSSTSLVLTLPVSLCLHSIFKLLTCTCDNAAMQTLPAFRSAALFRPCLLQRARAGCFLRLNVVASIQSPIARTSFSTSAPAPAKAPVAKQFRTQEQQQITRSPSRNGNTNTDANENEEMTGDFVRRVCMKVVELARTDQPLKALELVRAIDVCISCFVCVCL